MPPMVAPASTSNGSNGKYWPRSASAAAMSFTGVPASAVNVNSLGSYSTIPLSFTVEIFTTSLATADNRGFVPDPTASTRGADCTASASSSDVVTKMFLSVFIRAIRG